MGSFSLVAGRWSRSSEPRTTPPNRGLGFASIAIVVCSGLACSGVATAQVKLFSSKDAFLAAAGPQHLESFETTPLRECSTNSLSLLGVKVSDVAGFAVGTDCSLGICATDGVQYIKNCNDAIANSLTFTFSCPTKTFAIKNVDFGDISTTEVGTLTLTTNSGVNHQFASVPTKLANGNIIFIGVVSDIPFTEAKIIKTTSVGDGVNWDELYFTNSCCPSDFNHDGFVNGDDFDLYVEAFTAGNIAADFDGNGFVTGDDFDAFVAAFVDGC